MADLNGSSRMVVIKVGGSLFDLRDLGSRLQKLLDGIETPNKLLFPGGGRAADLVRDWHAHFVLSEVQSHWLAIESLDLNGQLLVRLLTQAGWTIDQVRFREQARQHTTCVLLPSRFLQGPEQTTPPDAPPHVWDVTSDALAAWTAIRWPADELVLLKSVPCPVGKTALEAVQRGLVDPYFPGYAGRLRRVSWCCLRDDEPQIVPWLEDGASASSQPEAQATE